MAFSTYAAFIPALMDMTVSGITTYADEPPMQISTAKLPLMFPRLPTGADSVVTVSGATGLQSATCEIVIVIEPLHQSLQPTNFAAALTMMDSLATTLKAATLSIGIDTWTMRVEQDYIGETPYWMIVATVEASG